jgi:hypothetical protein
LSDLAPYVEIDTPEKALRYVRLSTDYATSHTSLDDWYGAEILRDRSLSAAAGHIPTPVLQAIGWHSPTIRREGDRWVIERYVVLRRVLAGEDTIVRSSESIEPGGGYHLETKIVWKGWIDEVQWEGRI